MNVIISHKNNNTRGLSDFHTETTIAILTWLGVPSSSGFNNVVGYEFGVSIVYFVVRTVQTRLPENDDSKKPNRVNVSSRVPRTGVWYTVETWPDTIGFVGKFSETIAVVDEPFSSVRRSQVKGLRPCGAICYSLSDEA